MMSNVAKARGSQTNVDLRSAERLSVYYRNDFEAPLSCCSQMKIGGMALPLQNARVKITWSSKKDMTKVQHGHMLQYFSFKLLYIVLSLSLVMDGIILQ